MTCEAVRHPLCPTEMIDFPGPPDDEGRDQDPLRGAKSGESVEHGGTTETVPGNDLKTGGES